MVRGWIDREHYVAHFDPEKWPVAGGTAGGDAGGGALADSAVRAPHTEE